MVCICTVTAHMHVIETPKGLAKEWPDSATGKLSEPTAIDITFVEAWTIRRFMQSYFPWTDRGIKRRVVHASTKVMSIAVGSDSFPVAGSGHSFARPLRLLLHACMPSLYRCRPVALQVIPMLHFSFCCTAVKGVTCRLIFCGPRRLLLEAWTTRRFYATFDPRKKT